jgi:hypothetical protein
MVRIFERGSMSWWMNILIIVGALWITCRYVRGTATDDDPGAASEPGPQRAEPFVFTRHLFVAGLLEGPYAAQTSRPEDQGRHEERDA